MASLHSQIRANVDRGVMQVAPAAQQRLAYGFGAGIRGQPGISPPKRSNSGQWRTTSTEVLLLSESMQR